MTAKIKATRRSLITTSSRVCRSRTAVIAVCLAALALSPAQALGQSWTFVSPMLTARFHHGVGVLNGEIYAIGGVTGGGPLFTFLGVVERYDPVANVWVTRAPLPSPPRIRMCVEGVNGLLYSFGGETSTGVLASVDAYDPNNNVWIPKAPMPVALSDVACAQVNGLVYIVSGVGIPSRLTTVLVYNPVFNTWSFGGNIPSPREAPSAAAVGDIIYVVGPDAISGSGVNTIVDAYDTINQTWTAKASFAPGRNFLSTVAACGTIYAIGGQDTSGNPIAAVEAYDPPSDTWTTALPSLNIARRALPEAAVLAFVGGKPVMHVIGGLGPGVTPPNVFSSVETLEASIADTTIGTATGIQSQIAALPLPDFCGINNTIRSNNQTWLLNKIQGVQNQLMSGMTCNGSLGLLNNMLDKMNGCATGGTPDSNDKVCDCAAQTALSALINNLITTLTEAQADGCC